MQEEKEQPQTVGSFVECVQILIALEYCFNGVCVVIDREHGLCKNK